MKEFNVFFPELLGHAKIAEALRVVFIESFSAVSYPFSDIERHQTSLWFKNKCATLLDVATEKEKIIEAEKVENLAKIFDDLNVQTWTIGNKPNQPKTLNTTKADIVRQFLLALDYHNYDIVPVLERYLKSI